MPLSSDVVEWCNLPGYRDVLAAGMYELDEGSGERNGRLHLYRLKSSDSDTPSDGAGAGPKRSLQLLISHELPGVFDLRWHPTAPLLAAALADGSVRVLRPGLEDQQCMLTEVCSEEHSLAGPALATSLDYRCSIAGGGDELGLCVSYSDGSLQLCHATPSSLVCLSAWRAHDLEAWTVCPDLVSPNILYSGGDDCAFKKWDTRLCPRRVCWADKRTHGAGVCCVSPSAARPHLVCTGSYDDCVRVWDTRAIGQPLMTAQVRRED
jgi:diphthamide biosynthesis protein 7